MSKIKNATVLITGAGSGLGRLLAQHCQKEGAFQLILWDINQKGLNETAALLGQEQDVVTQVVDISQPEEVRLAAETVLNNYGPVDILFNNAGVVVGKSFAEHTIEDIQRTIGVNITGVMCTASAFLGEMIAQQRGHIINIASAAGLLPNPNMSVYAGSKWAVIGWSESLRLEMEAHEGDLHVTTVEPSYINTGMFDGVKAPLLTPIMQPEYIADKIIKAVKTNQIVLREPFMVKSIPVLRGILPTRTFDFLARTMGVYDSMDSFIGRNDRLKERLKKR